MVSGSLIHSTYVWVSVVKVTPSPQSGIPRLSLHLRPHPRVLTVNRKSKFPLEFGPYSSRPVRSLRPSKVRFVLDTLAGTVTGGINTL